MNKTMAAPTQRRSLLREVNRAALILYSRRPLEFCLVVVSFMGFAVAGMEAEILFPKLAFLFESACVIFWPALFLLVIFVARVAHLGERAAHQRGEDVARAAAALIQTGIPLMVVPVVGSYFEGIGSVPVAAAAIFPLLALLWFATFSTLLTLFHGLGKREAEAMAFHAAARQKTLSVTLILVLIPLLLGIALMLGNTLTGAWFGAMAFIHVATCSYLAWTVSFEDRRAPGNLHAATRQTVSA